MKKLFFISAIVILIAFTTNAQHHQPVGAAGMEPTGKKKVLFHTSLNIIQSIQLPSDDVATGYRNGQLLFSGLVRKQKLQGNWMSFYKDASKIDSGYMHKGIPDGEWKRWDSSGNLLAIRNYDADKLLQVKEEMRMAHPKRSFYALTELYKFNRSQALYALSSAYSFSFSASQRSLQSLQQAVVNNSTNENNYQPVFNECLHHGLYMNFFSEGISKDSGYYKNGLKDAVWMHRKSASGNYYIGTYKNGLPVKEWKLYNNAGRLLSITFYNKEGREEWTKVIYR